jgi:hypothetical protein
MWLFPNLDGEWEMEIHWRKNSETHGKVSAKAVIRQNFTRISMEVAAPDSDSEILIARPKRDPESGHPLFYYKYRAVRKQKGKNTGADYIDAAILRFKDEGGGKLNGNYFTSAHATGHFVLSRTNL